MTTEFAWETLAQVRADPALADLLDSEYHEICEDRDRLQHKPDWDMYKLVEDMGRWMAYTARRGGRLIGYIAFWVQPHIHHKGMVLACDDLFYVDPAERDFVVAHGLFAGVEERFRELGVTAVILHEKWSARAARNDDILCARLVRKGMAADIDRARKIVAEVRGQETALGAFFRRHGYRPFEKRWLRML